jgi:hypothetical protein
MAALYHRLLPAAVAVACSGNTLYSNVFAQSANGLTGC